MLGRLDLSYIGKTKALVISVLVLCLLSCGGGGSNNDQGVSFTLLGFFEEPSSDASVVGVTVPLGEPGGETSDTVTRTLVFIGTQNNLVGQIVRLERANISYVIGGASAQPPDTSVVMSGILGPAGIAGPGSVSTLPPGLADLPNTNFQETPILTNDILAWISLNRRFLPEPPFTAEAYVTVRGVTSAGDVLETNQAGIRIYFAPENVISGGGSSGAATEDEVLEEDEEEEF